MSNTLPINPNDFKLGSAIVPNSSGATYGTHYSYLGVGGYVEVPDNTYRNGIPAGANMNADGYSSGRRRFGMLVYVMDTDKAYRLIPKKNDGNRVTMAEWEAASDSQKLVWIDPLKTIFDFTTFQNFTGTGNADDAWMEVEDVTVSGGTYDSGTLTIVTSAGQSIDISLTTLVNTIVNSADIVNDQMVFRNQLGDPIFSVDVSSLTNNLVASGATTDQTDVVTEEELTERINTDFSIYLENNVNNLL